MKLGTKSLLFGAHQLVLHPIFVLWGWIKLYGWGTITPRILLAIIIHDWWYWGEESMDGGGKYHPIEAALWVSDHLGTKWDDIADEILLHSRHLSKELKVQPSRLCWADKLSLKLMGGWLWAILAHLSKEGYEYMENPYGQDYVKGQSKNVRGLKKFHESFCEYMEVLIIVGASEWTRENSKYLEE